MSRAPRDYETAIAESPLRHAIFNKPFLTLRKRTESLLDTITGGTLPAEVLEAERRRKDRDRQLKCRGCRILFADEIGLANHHRLFPAHINPPEYKPSKSRRPRQSRRSQSTSDALYTVPSSRPRPSTRHRADTDPHMLALNAPHSNPLMHPISTSAEEALLSPPALPPKILGFDAQQALLVAGASDMHHGDGPSTFIDQEVVENNINQRPHEEVPPRPLPAPPLLLPVDFSTFQSITEEGFPEPPLARSVPPRDETEKSRIRHAISAAKLTPEMTEERHQRMMVRGTSESALDTLPTTLGGVVRSVIATGTNGPRGGAVIAPEHTSISAGDTAYRVIAEQEDEITTRPKNERKESRTRDAVAALRGPLPGAPDRKIAEKCRSVEPLPSGITSFSTDTILAAPPSPTFRRIIPRRNTNPFLNEAFMSTMSSSLKTPPLSPSSPFSRLSPGNPFAQLPDHEAKANDEDDLGHSPKTPFDFGEVQRTTSFEHSEDLYFIPVPSTSNEDDVFLRSPLRESGTKIQRKTPSVATVSGSRTTTERRGVHFDAKTALKASDNPRCPTCRRIFVDLDSVLDHMDRTSCNPYQIGEAIYAQ